MADAAESKRLYVFTRGAKKMSRTELVSMIDGLNRQPSQNGQKLFQLTLEPGKGRPRQLLALAASFHNVTIFSVNGELEGLEFDDA